MTGLPRPQTEFQPSASDMEFMKFLTGIDDEELLKRHVNGIREEAYKIFPYPYISAFAFARRRIDGLPAYTKCLQLGRERKDAIFLDIGCGFGNDVRAIITDGYPIENVVASDLKHEFWDLGHKLFRSTAESLPVPFLEGDVFDPSFLSPSHPFYSPPDTPSPDLNSIMSLSPLLGHISVIHASLLFHLFDEEGQSKLARLLASLLSPRSGSLIFGSHTGRFEKGLNPTSWPGNVDSKFCHSPESWEALWDGCVFEKGTVKVEATLNALDADMERLGMTAEEGRMYRIAWSVTRV
ncbi:hypothetical protein CERSUDRAFT_154156 [Gelatoporia subvermispora B]|uniref:Methyltransferase domain-containing protein n=1 Tax=Ceriporiopsis subvermispora (strain B) TaxID=914234 RepID=M2RGB9_CERS8|nr:hypothetical protein CERSUDRAFT_154156 [Gelatoporia subvermispora B]